ncbi:hypothetical protein GCM10009535_33170 [Streptomyces thermocarboxydovorans]|uniref:Uncharacterized protein n=1 Tax=Streptomyces thermocarboxydovorans TaxID=59298 RepID=A0ABP3SPW2_9ACTN
MDDRIYNGGAGTPDFVEVEGGGLTGSAPAALGDGPDLHLFVRGTDGRRRVRCAGLGLGGRLPEVGAARQQPPLIPGADFLSWDGQSFTVHDEPAVAGEGQSRTLPPAPVPGTATVWSVGRANGPGNSVVPRILRFG